MIATLSFKIYEVLHKHFKNEADAKIVVQEIEIIIDNKFDKERNSLATKEDVSDIRQDLLKFQVEMEKRFTTTMVTIITTVIAAVGIAVAILKL
jgi:hypothetical protein